MILGDIMYTPLYIKTHNSLLSSMIKIDELIVFAKKNELKSLTITDNNMYGVMEFYNACLKNDIKPIIGIEIYDILLYAINYEGYKNLLKLTTIMSEIEITIKDLEIYSSDLICIVPYKSIDKYNDLSKIYKYIFKGYRNLDERKELSGDNLIYLNEVLYLEEADSSYLKYLYAIKDGISIKDVKLEKIENHLLSYKLYTQDLENNYLITDLVDIRIPFHQNLLPIYECPNGMGSFEYLKQLVTEGMKKKFGTTVNKKYLDRLKYELDVINKMGFCNYFLVVWDYVKFAKENDILVGTGRGSAAGSLVSYCLDITAIDPIEYDLLFERFLNPERITMPDIDIDFEYTRREEVISYCINKYGRKKVAPIITFGTLGAKQAIRDVGKALETPLKTVDYICKLIDSRETLIDNYNKNSKLKDHLSNNPELKQMYKIALKFEGLKRHTSIHAAGIVMANINLDEVIPLDMNHGGFYTTGYSMEYLEDLGLLKMDILALRNLTLINDVLKEIPELTFDNIPLEDKDAINIFTEVDTIGIFQFESDGMMSFLRKFKPSLFEDVVAAIALYRPGPMKNIDSYIKRKKGEEEIDYIDDSLVKILKPTYGIIVYQEQIMQIANILANYSLAEADVLRKAMSKKKEDVLLKEKDKFINQSIDNGYSEEIATRVYNLILKFASYGFNRAHSVSYAMIAYKMAYLKVHYSLIFMKHLLNNVIGSEIKTKEYINACKLKNIEVVKPNINISTNQYEIIDNKIYFPLTNIKSVGTAAAISILQERKNGKFKDIFDFVARCLEKSVNTKVLQNLIAADCFRDFHFNHKTLDENLEILTNYSELGSLLEGDDFKPELVIYDEYSKKELMQMELDIFGFYLSNHPVTEYKTKYKAIDLNKLENYFNQEIVTIIFVERKKEITTKNNEKMLFITGSDESRNIDLVLFPKLYRDGIEVGDIYLVKARVEKRFDKYQLIINNLKKLN